MTEQMHHCLFEMAKAVFLATGDDKIFRQRQKKFTDTYKRASYAEQGEYHHLWCKWMKEATT